MRVAVLSLADPDGPPHGGALRVRSLAAALERAGHEVHRVFPATSATSAVPGAEGVGVSRGERALPDVVRRAKRSLLPMPTQLGARNASLADHLRLVDPDVLVVTAFSQVWAREAVPRARLWLDLLDVWSAVARREAGARSGLARLTARGQAEVIRRREARVCREAEVITVVGWHDREILNRRGEQPTWLPVTLPESAFAPVPPEQPRVAGLLGNYRFWPNRDAYERLVEVWAPALRDAGWDVVVAGLGAEELPSSPRVRNLGELADAAEFYRQVGLVVAPIALGGGMKVKVVEALARGRPVLGSEEAVEGLPPDVRGMVRVSSVGAPDVPLAAPDLPDDRLERLTPYRISSLDAAVQRLIAVL